MSDPATSQVLVQDSKDITPNKPNNLITNEKKISENTNNIINENSRSSINGNNNSSNNFISNFIIPGNSNGNTNANNSTTRRESSLTYPSLQRSNPRNDSIGMFTNFNLPRFSTDSSIAPFLNIADSNNNSNNNSSNINNKNNNNNDNNNNNNNNIQNNDNFSNLNDNIKRRSQDLTQIARGYSIVNGNIWTQQTIPSISNNMQTRNANSNTNNSNNMDQLDVNGAPKFKPLSFSAGKSKTNAKEAIRNESFSIPPSNIGPSLYQSDNQDIDLLQQNNNSRGSISNNMKPPAILPMNNNINPNFQFQPKFQNSGLPRRTSSNSNLNNVPSTLPLEAFLKGGNSRQNSLKIGNDDFDFDTRRRNSSIKLLLDNTQNIPSTLHGQSASNNLNIPKDSIRQNYQNGLTSFPSSLSRFSSIITGDESNNCNNGNNSNNNILNHLKITKNNDSSNNQKLNAIKHDDSLDPLSTIGTVLTLTNKRILNFSADEKEGNKISKNSKFVQNQNLGKSAGNLNNNNHTPNKKTYPETRTSRGSTEKRREGKITKKSSFEDVLKKIAKDSKINEEIAKEVLLKENDDTATTLLGVTKIDQLMLMIDARKKGITEKVETGKDGKLLIAKDSDILPPTNEIVGGVEKPVGSHGIKQHECKLCHRFFTQLTHLEVHIRSHIGYKPFECQYCRKRFTQGGNLRTHLRLHTGEKPYDCDVCKKKFSRKSNLTAHTLTHGKVKPFVCKLDNCYKTFTQLGNMKAHQNGFHLDALSKLTVRLAQLDPNEIISPDERELLEYFASLYKNSNKGIKGRGKTTLGTSDSNTVRSDETLKNKTINAISPEYQLYPASGVEQQNQQHQIIDDRITPGTTIHSDIAHSLDIDLQQPNVQLSGPQIPGVENMGSIPIDQHAFLSVDNGNRQMMDQGGVEFKFVNYKK